MSAARLVVPLAALLLCAACADEGGGDATDGGELEGVTWMLDASSAASLGEAPADVTATIRFDHGQAGGSAFCNTYGGSYEIGDGGSLTIEVGGMTQMACEEPLMSLELAFVDALDTVTAYETGDDALTLMRESGDPLTFTAEQPLPLVGTSWRLDGIATGADAVSSTLAGTEATATFDVEDRVSGDASCNRYGASYSVDGDSIEIGDDVMSTAMACEPDVMAQETAFLDGLGRAATFGIEGSTLTLLDADGAFLLSFVGRESRSASA